MRSDTVRAAGIVDDGVVSWMLSFSTVSSQSSPIFLHCTLVNSSEKDNRLTLVDQVVLDTAKPSIDFRVAETMATSEPLNFTFDNSSQSTLSFQSTGGGMLFVSLRWGAANAISLDAKGHLVLTYTKPGYGSFDFRWNCHEYK